MNLKNLQIVKMLDNYSGSGDYRQDIKNLLENECPDLVIEAILEMVMLTERPDDFKILYPESEVL